NKILAIEHALQRDGVIDQYLIKEIGEPDIAAILTHGQEIYAKLPEEEREALGNEACQSYEEAMCTPAYKKLYAKLEEAKNIARVNWIDLRFLDEERDRYVYVMDTGAKGDGRREIGYWEKDDIRTLSSFDYEYEEGDFIDTLPVWMVDIIYTLENLVEIDKKDSLNQFSMLFPIFDADTGALVGYLGIGEYIGNYQENIWSFYLVFAVMITILLVVITLIARMGINRNIVRPIRLLSNAAKTFVADNRLLSGHFFKQVEIPVNDEVGLLRDSMAEMEMNLINYMDNVTQMAAEKERLSTEMELSTRIQEGVLPKELEGFFGEKNFEVNAMIYTAREVGGDFYDFFPINDEKIALVMADVSGKGVPAALFMMEAKILVMSMAKEDLPPAEVIERVNRQLCLHNDEAMFVTAWFGIYDVRKKSIAYINAGHEFPALYRPSEGAFSLVVEENDFILGFDPETRFTEREFSLESGDRLFLYTDGVPEAQRPSGEQYGNDRMLCALNKGLSCRGEEFLNTIKEDVAGFVGDADQFDDITMLLLEIE
ncbi:MAG: SpoIIE family protein phosphatase, partial [Lachnospiraceae bacterium]|nr:SpoIIE family protein phosphatase [Lachnospiraceae bacterium]